MTHTNHRSGTTDSLEKDYVVFMYGAKGINSKKMGPELREFLKLAKVHRPVNYGTLLLGNMLTMSYEELMEKLDTQNKVYIVFDNKETAAGFIKEVKEKDFGISIVISALIDEVENISRDSGITPHTAQCSLGVWGKTELLPDQRILDITTMCGHAMVSFNLVHRMADEVSHGRISLSEAAAKMSKPCLCGVFNPARAAELLKQFIAESDVK